MIYQAIDIVICFTVSFVCFFLAHKATVKSQDKRNRSEILKARIKKLEKQQDRLLESANEKISIFLKQSEDFDQVDDTLDSFIGQVQQIMNSSSITDISAPTFLIACTVGGVCFTALILYFDFFNYIFGIPIGFFTGVYIVYSILVFKAERRKMKFLSQLPDAIDMMIRGVKAGLNIGRVMKLVSMEARDPIANECLIISQKFELGVKPEQALLESAERINIEEFRFLIVALVLQIENGGVLGEVLTNLSNIVRKRLELGLKMKAASAEARISAIIISALPFVFAIVMAFVNPDHFSEFTKPGPGQTLLKTAVILFSMGIFFMLKATKIKV